MKKLLGILMLAVSFSCETIDPTQPGNLVPKTVMENPNLPSLTVNSTTLHLESFGTPGDPLLIFLHDGPGGDYRNAQQIKEMANQGFEIVLFNQRGSGLSQRHAFESINIDVLFEDLKQIIAHFKINE
jgi:proline iminopeptidase